MDSYWDTDSTETNEGCDSGDSPTTTCGSRRGATPLTTTEMQAVTGTYPNNLGDGFQLSAGSYPRLYQCEIDPTTNGCSGSFSTELLPGQE